MLHALPIAQRRAGTIQRQSDHNPQALNAVSQNIVQAFDTRPYLLHTTRAEDLAATTANLCRATRFRRRIRTRLDNGIMADETGSRFSGRLKAQLQRS